FFERLISQNSYDNLLTAHHLGDRFEWMLMQFCRGAGCVELSGMKESDKRSNYTLLRPLLHLEKSELLEYLKEEDILYFEDESNTNEKYKRNYFRTHHTKPLLAKYAQGIKKSFEYIDEDSQILHQEVAIKEIDDFAYFTASSWRSDIVNIDAFLKTKGFLMSANERELLKKEKTVVISRKIVINQEHGFVFIMPFLKASDMSKEFKEKMRILKVEPKLRPFIYKNAKVQMLITTLLS
ncbi:MAG: tRNA lysidine(34) synthetase TilS, partial [Sulfurimonas sp.]